MTIPKCLRIALCTCLFFVNSPAVSKTQRLASSGDWAFMRADFSFMFISKTLLRLRGLCTARTGNKSDFFSVSIFKGGGTVLQIRRDQWSWPKRRGDVTFKANDNYLLTSTFQGAVYRGNFIENMTAPEGGGASYGGVSQFELLANNSRQTGKIEVFDHRNKLIAHFSSRGFKEMLDKAIQCSKR